MLSYLEKLFQTHQSLIHEAKQQQHRHPIAKQAISEDQFGRENVKSDIEREVDFFYRGGYDRIHCMCFCL